MHGTIFILKEKPDWLDEYEVFEYLKGENNVLSGKRL